MNNYINERLREITRQEKDAKEKPFLEKVASVAAGLLMGASGALSIVANPLLGAGFITSAVSFLYDAKAQNDVDESVKEELNSEKSHLNSILSNGGVPNDDKLKEKEAKLPEYKEDLKDAKADAARSEDLCNKINLFHLGSLVTTCLVTAVTGAVSVIPVGLLAGTSIARFFATRQHKKDCLRGNKLLATVNNIDHDVKVAKMADGNDNKAGNKPNNEAKKGQEKTAAKDKSNAKDDKTKQPQTDEKKGDKAKQPQTKKDTPVKDNAKSTNDKVTGAIDIPLTAEIAKGKASTDTPLNEKKQTNHIPSMVDGNTNNYNSIVTPITRKTGENYIQPATQMVGNDLFNQELNFADDFSILYFAYLLRLTALRNVLYNRLANLYYNMPKGNMNANGYKNEYNNIISIYQSEFNKIQLEYYNLLVMLYSKKVSSNTDELQFPQNNMGGVQKVLQYPSKMRRAA